MFNGELDVRLVDDEVFLVFLVFKIMLDFYGCFIFFWVYFGVLVKGSYILNFIKGKKERIFCLIVLKVDDRIEVDELWVGDLGVVVGLKDILIGDIVCDKDYLIILEFFYIFELVIFVVVELKIK